MSAICAAVTPLKHGSDSSADTATNPALQKHDHVMQK